MKIGLFIKDFAAGKKFDKTGLPIKSGAEFHGENHARILKNQGNIVYIMAKKRYWWTKAREIINGIDLVRLHNPFRWLEIIFRLHTTHRNTDAFYIIGRPNFAVWCILYANYYNIPTTMALTGKAEIFDKKANWRNKIFAQCTNYIATTQEIKDGFINMGEIDSRKVHLLAHGIDMERFKVVGKFEKEKLRDKLDIPKNKKVLLFCARVVLNKGIDTLQTVWKYINAEKENCILIVAGGGPNGLLDELRALSKDTKNTVRVLGEIDLPEEYYRAADVYIFPSRHEGLPTSLIEAMASGLPAVVSDIGGCEDLIMNDFNGYRVFVEDAREFADKIIYLFNNEDKRLEMANNSAEFAHANFGYERIIGKLEQIIKNEI